MDKILVTGAAGFIGFHLSKLLCEKGFIVVGIDSLNNYYDSTLKQDRLAELRRFESFSFQTLDVCDATKLNFLFEEEGFDIVIHLAAQAGVRYSLKDPHTYIQNNVVGFMNILEACRLYKVRHLLFASSSSVYGANTETPYHPDHMTDHPMSLYAATKKTNELMAHSYASLYMVPITGMRFFTVYGSWGRPDMAYFSFTKNILEENTINLFNGGDLKRDFTHVSDVVESIYRLLDKPPYFEEEKRKKRLTSSESYAPYQIFNIGNNKPVRVGEFVAILEGLLDKKAKIEKAPMQPGDVYETYADIDTLIEKIDYQPQVSIQDGLEEFVSWYRKYYQDR